MFLVIEKSLIVLIWLLFIKISILNCKDKDFFIKKHHQKVLILHFLHILKRFLHILKVVFIKSIIYWCLAL
jgi:hypothetical protein